MPQPPCNFLFVQTDQLTASMLSVYGNTVAKTPHLDQLAEQGVVFDSAYCNFPLCAPSRFSMMSGRIASNIGAYDNGAEFPSSIPTFAHYLRASGYQTCLVGKMHFVGADQLHGFEQRLTTDIYPSNFGWTGDWTEVRMPHGNNPLTFTNAGICKRNVQMDYDDEVLHRARRKIYDLARSGDDRPFLLMVSITHPHDPYQCRQEHWDRYRPQDVDMPKTDRLDFDKYDPYSKRLMVQYGLEDFIPSDQQIHTARQAYYGSLSYVDDLVGSMFSTLDDAGLSDNTAIIFTSDHGDMLGERGMWYKKSFYESSCRVPLIIRAPGVKPERIGKNVSLVDLLPTILELSGNADLPDQVTTIDGTSLCALLAGDASQWKDTVYAENLAEGAAAPVLMVKQGNLKYVVSGIDPPLLCDLDSDPDENHNIVDNPEVQTELNQLKGLSIQQWDLENLAKQVEASQRTRLFLKKTLATGQPVDWDYDPVDQASEQCLRLDQSYNQWAYDNVLGLQISETGSGDESTKD